MDLAELLHTPSQVNRLQAKGLALALTKLVGTQSNMQIAAVQQRPVHQLSDVQVQLERLPNTAYVSLLLPWHFALRLPPFPPSLSQAYRYKRFEYNAQRHDALVGGPCLLDGQRHGLHSLSGVGHRYEQGQRQGRVSVGDLIAFQQDKDGCSSTLAAISMALF